MARVKATVEVNRPLESCYRVWSDVSSWATFMPGLHSIRPKGDPAVWHCEMKGPSGKLMQWDIHLDALKHRNRMISWHTVRQADLPHSGAVTFELTDGGTLAKLVVDADIPAEEEPYRFEQFLQHAVQATLMSFKALVEKQPVSSR